MSGALGRRVAKLAELAETLTTRTVVAIILELSECPPWAEPLPDGRCVLLGLGDRASRDAVLKALQTGGEPPKTALVLEYRHKVSRFIADAVDGRENSELLAVSPRGEGKSQGALGARWRTPSSTGARACVAGAMGHRRLVAHLPGGDSRPVADGTVVAGRVGAR